MSLHFVEAFSLIKTSFSRKDGIKIYKSQLVGVPRIGLGLRAPKARVLPIYYTPAYKFTFSSILILAFLRSKSKKTAAMSI